jgi:hypothetical protein
LFKGLQEKNLSPFIFHSIFGTFKSRVYPFEKAATMAVIGSRHKANPLSIDELFDNSSCRKWQISYLPETQIANRLYK